MNDNLDNSNSLDFEIGLASPQENESIIIRSDYTDLKNPVVNVHTKVSRKYRTTNFQARLGKRLDSITRKVLDNRIALTAHPTDMLRISAKRDPRSGDLLTRTITANEVVPIIFPNMQDVPLRRFASQDGEDVLLPSFYAFSADQHFDLYSPTAVQVDIDDLLVRLVYSEDRLPWISVLQVKDILSTVGYNSVLYNKLQCTFYDETLPEKVSTLIREAIEKREQLGW